MEKKKEAKQKIWKEIQNNLADGNGMAVIVVDENSKVIDEANNNSICKILYSSAEFSSECDKFCGKAFEMANRAGKTVEYKCYAGLECRAVPVKIDEKIKFVAIVGRAFTKTSNYREAAERAFSGDWKKFPLTKFFENVLLKGVGNDLETVVKSIENFDDNKKNALEKFVEKENIQKSFDIENSEKSNELEILRLREELKRRGWLEQTVRKFNDILREIDSDDFWLQLTQIFAELMRAERSSLLLVDEKTGKLFFKAAIGTNAAAIEEEKDNLGVRVARQVLAVGKPLIIEDVDKIGLKVAPVERNYNSKSFISYPLSIGARRIGVLNLTDKTDGESYNNFDLKLLNSIMPQLAVLIDRAALKHKAGEFEQLSVTDALTGLLNRRYLEERLAEEIKRSNREGFPMSFLMIDVDDFKSYNDKFSHPEGDKALKLVAKLFKDTLRGADVAARYGGEEFSILLPQTTLDEAKTIAERIRKNVEKTKFDMRRVTVSIGIASCSKIICNAQEIISAADKALYRAKSLGRNNVQIFEDSIDEQKSEL
ncbi:MAG: diguanylate cyclase [Acidobacteriota bacterium]